MADYKTLKELVAQDERFRNLKFGSAETGETVTPARGVMNRPSTSFAAVEQGEDEVSWIESIINAMRNSSTDPVRVERAVLGRGGDDTPAMPDPSLYQIKPLEEVIGRPSQTDLAFNRALDLPEGISPGEYAMLKPEGLSFGRRETVSTAGATPEFEETASRLTRDLMRDFDLTETQAAALVGNLAVESNNFQTLQEIDPLVEGSRGGFGYAQWTGPRREAFESWAAENELDPSSYEANYGYLKKELSETDDIIGNIGRNTIDRLRDMDNLNEATSFVMEYYLRPGIQHEGRRQESAAEILGLMSRQD